MERAIKKCDLTSDTSGLTLGDGNHTLILDGKGKKDYAGIEYA